MKIFESNPWFSSLPAADAGSLLSEGTLLRLSPGDMAFEQGEAVDSRPQHAFFGVVSGMLKASVLDPSGKETILSIIEPGNWFGEVALLDPSPRFHSVIAVQDTEMLAVSQHHFHTLMQRASFAGAVARQLSMRQRLLYELMSDWALYPVRERLARRLVMLSRGDLSQTQDGHRSLRTSQEVLAMLLGVSRPTLNKELNALVDEGAIKLLYGRIEVVDFEALVRCGQSRSGNTEV
jgi:CRP-like cAMP-binding protein